MTASTHTSAPAVSGTAAGGAPTSGASGAPGPPAARSDLPAPQHTPGTREASRVGAPADPSSADLGDLFHTAFRGLRRKWAHQLSPFDVTPHQWRALNTVAGHGSGHASGSGMPGMPGVCAPAGGTLRLKELAERLRIAPRSATEVVDQLEAKSLLVRLPDPSDRRATLIALTDAGDALRDRVLAARREQSDEFFSRLSDVDRRELGRLLELLGTHDDCP